MCLRPLLQIETSDLGKDLLKNKNECRRFSLQHFAMNMVYMATTRIVIVYKYNTYNSLGYNT